MNKQKTLRLIGQWIAHHVRAERIYAKDGDYAHAASSATKAGQLKDIRNLILNGFFDGEEDDHGTAEPQKRRAQDTGEQANP